MRLPSATNPKIRIALIETDPLRSVGFRALLQSESDLELVSASVQQLDGPESFNVVLVGAHGKRNLHEMLEYMQASMPQLPIVVVGPENEDKSILSAIVAGAKGYVSDDAAPQELARAIRMVNGGSVWAPRIVLSMFVELAVTQRKRMLPGAHQALSNREKEVLALLVSGLSNKEIGAPLGIEERTVKAHISQMMRKVGVHNRIALTTHAITHSLLSSRSDAPATVSANL